MNMLRRNNMNLQDVFEQQVIMHTFSYNFCHLLSTTLKLNKINKL